MFHKAIEKNKSGMFFYGPRCISTAHRMLLIFVSLALCQAQG